MEPVRQFEVVSNAGERFVVVEHGSFRWERGPDGGRIRVENSANYLRTQCGHEVIRTDTLGAFHIVELGVDARLFDETVTPRNLEELNRALVQPVQV